MLAESFLLVESRMIDYVLGEYLWTPPLPIFHRSYGGLVLQHLLWDVVIVQPTGALQRLYQVFARDIATRRQYITDSAIEAFHHSVRLRKAC